MKKKSTVSLLLRSLKPYAGWLVLTTLFSLLYVFTSLLIPYFVGKSVDLLLGVNNVDFTRLGEYLLSIALSIAGAALSNYGMNLTSNRLSFSLTKDLRKAVFEHIHTLPLSYLDREGTGDILSRMSNDIDTLSDGLLLGFTTLFTGVLTILWTFLLMILMNWFMALVVLVLTPVSLLISRFIAKNISSYFRKQSEIKSEATAYIEEMVPNHALLTEFGRKEASEKEFGDISLRLEKTSIKAMFFSSLVNPTTRVVNAVVYALIAFLGAFLVIGKFTLPGAALTVGGLTTLLSYASQFSKPFNDISQVITELQNALTCAGRVYELLEVKSEEDGSAELAAIRGDIDIRHVYFSYSKERKLIEDFSLSVKKGQKIAIVGPTGCGKTTLINLLMHFYDVDSGAIEVDGKNTREVRRASLHENIGMVLQDTWLRYGTVLENITLGRDIPEAKVREACRKCHADDFIMKMKNGYDTVMEENGGSLSAGQKQLLCIARVMCEVPSILILDEATSNIDTRTEMLIQDAFDEMTEGRTSFLVAHRLSTIRSADMILVMKDGHVIEQGNHEELLKRKGFYSSLYEAQFRK